MRQRFAVACLRFATTAFASSVVNPLNTSIESEECPWIGLSCDEGGRRVTQLDVARSRSIWDVGAYKFVAGRVDCDWECPV